MIKCTVGDLRIGDIVKINTVIWYVKYIDNETRWGGLSHGHSRVSFVTLNDNSWTSVMTYSDTFPLEKHDSVTKCKLKIIYGIK